jgi:hypothetical protein
MVNKSSSTYVAWCWKAGGSASSNSNGSITSSVSAGSTQGFSIVSYTGNNTAGATIGHGLSSGAPDIVIEKKRSGSANWDVWGDLLGSTNMMNFNTTAASFNPGGNYHNDTMPNSTVVTLGNDADVNGSSTTHIMYCFRSVQGYSKISSYSGNGSDDGSYIHLGFRPAMIILKNTETAKDWNIWDTKRDPYNGANHLLYPSLSNAEGSGTVYLDLLSNGFKLRNSNNKWNSTETFIYMAFAEAPFVNSKGVPCNAR